MGEQASILIVDDDPSLVRTTSLILEHRGYAVTTASSGAEAIEKTEKTAFDLVFIDIKMPGMDGVETLRRVRRLRPAATAVMISAYATDDRVREALQLGAHGILYKPLDIDQMVGQIEGALATADEMSVLVVDDDSATCLTLQNILSHKGYGVTTAAAGEEAIELVRANRYQVIFLDLRLPTLNGLDTYLAIRELDCEVVVVMITAWRSESDDLVRTALAKTVHRCLDKPLEMAKVFEVLEEIRTGRAAMTPRTAGGRRGGTDDCGRGEGG